MRDLLLLRINDSAEDRSPEPLPKIVPRAWTVSLDDDLKVFRHPFENDVPVPFVVAVDVEHFDDVGMAKILQHLDLALEALARPFVCGSKPHPLDSNRSAFECIERLRYDRLRP
nr:hypothetical protein [Bradyrhizobium sp.]